MLSSYSWNSYIFNRWSGNLNSCSASSLSRARYLSSSMICAVVAVRCISSRRLLIAGIIAKTLCQQVKLYWYQSICCQARAGACDPISSRPKWLKCQCSGHFLGMTRCRTCNMSNSCAAVGILVRPLRQRCAVLTDTPHTWAMVWFESTACSMYDDLKKSMSIPLFVELRAGKVTRGDNGQKIFHGFLDYFCIWAQKMPRLYKTFCWDGLTIGIGFILIAHNV